ncbi:endolysin [Leuconostoc phage LN04]|uniref:Putative lysin n=1 Tax=Leuconostoc phage LN04 TaxID=1262516 RepID=M4I6N8_9CAUD|nr:endolysin [Leuconostoc phage LN04]AFY98278.1 putative lysin [Leuconostoc phage LN04]
MTNYNVTIKEITSTTAGQGFTIGQGGVISIEFNPTLASSIQSQLPAGDFYLIKFTDENKFMYVPSARFKATFNTSVIVEPEPIESPLNIQSETSSSINDSTSHSELSKSESQSEVPTDSQSETSESMSSLSTSDSTSEQPTLDFGDKNHG